MRNEGTVFRPRVDVGVDPTFAQLRDRYDAVVLADRCHPVAGSADTGRELAGIHQAMAYLPQANRAALGAEVEDQILATGKHVVIIGGGDTGADCLGTVHRQGPTSVTQLEILPKPDHVRPVNQPWPMYPMIYRVAAAHEEGGERVYAVSTQEFLGDDDGAVRALRIVDVELKEGRFIEVSGSEREIPAELVLFALGFTGPGTDSVVGQLDLELDTRGNVARDEFYMSEYGRCLRRRRCRTRAVADRLGDRGGPRLRGSGRRIPHRVHGPSGPDTPECPPADGLT